MRDLYVTPTFHKDLRKIPRYITDQADQVIIRLRINPLDQVLNITKLKIDSKPTLWRVRLGQYRLVYSFDNS